MAAEWSFLHPVLLLVLASVCNVVHAQIELTFNPGEKMGISYEQDKSHTAYGVIYNVADGGKAQTQGAKAGMKIMRANGKVLTEKALQECRSGQSQCRLQLVPESMWKSGGQKHGQKVGDVVKDSVEDVIEKVEKLTKESPPASFDLPKNDSTAALAETKRQEKEEEPKVESANTEETEGDWFGFGIGLAKSYAGAAYNKAVQMAARRENSDDLREIEAATEVETLWNLFQSKKSKGDPKVMKAIIDKLRSFPQELSLCKDVAEAFWVNDLSHGMKAVAEAFWANDPSHGMEIKAAVADYITECFEKNLPTETRERVLKHAVALLPKARDASTEIADEVAKHALDLLRLGIRKAVTQTQEQVAVPDATYKEVMGILETKHAPLACNVLHDFVAWIGQEQSVKKPKTEDQIEESKDCARYAENSHWCSWTKEWNCPGQTTSVSKGAAKIENTEGYECCCNQGVWKKMKEANRADMVSIWDLVHLQDRERTIWDNDTCLSDLLAQIRNVLTLDELPSTALQPSNVPAIDASDGAKSQSLAKALKTKIVGQDCLIDRLAKSPGYVYHRMTGKWSKTKPLVYLFTGPSGVGKTEMARHIAQAINGASSDVHVIGMDKYSTEEDKYNFFGAPLGMAGAGEGRLMKVLQKSPNAVIVLDEIEKAHHKIAQMLLSTFDAHGYADDDRTVSTSQATFILTSNLAKRKILRMADEKMLAVPSCSSYEKLREEIKNTLKGKVIDDDGHQVENFFQADELRARLADTLPFLPFDNKTVEDGIRLLFSQESAAMPTKYNKHVSLAWEPGVVLYIREEYAKNREEGLRGVKKYIEEKVNDIVNQAVQADLLLDNSQLVLRYLEKQDKLDLRVVRHARDTAVLQNTPKERPRKDFPGRSPEPSSSWLFSVAQALFISDGDGASPGVASSGGGGHLQKQFAWKWTWKQQFTRVWEWALDHKWKIAIGVAATTIALVAGAPLIASGVGIKVGTAGAAVWSAGSSVAGAGVASVTYVAGGVATAVAAPLVVAGAAGAGALVVTGWYLGFDWRTCVAVAVAVMAGSLLLFFPPLQKLIWLLLKLIWMLLKPFRWSLACAWRCCRCCCRTSNLKSDVANVAVMKPSTSTPVTPQKEKEHMEHMLLTPKTAELHAAQAENEKLKQQVAETNEQLEKLKQQVAETKEAPAPDLRTELAKMTKLALIKKAQSMDMDDAALEAATEGSKDDVIELLLRTQVSAQQD